MTGHGGTSCSLCRTAVLALELAIGLKKWPAKGPADARSWSEIEWDHDLAEVRPEPTKAVLGLEQPVQVAISIPRELEQECLLVAAMGDVPDMTRHEMSVRTRHLARLKASDSPSKVGR